MTNGDRKIFFMLFLGSILCALCVLPSCNSRDDKSQDSRIASPADLNRSGMTIGVPQGAAAMTVGERVFAKAKILYYHSLAEGYAAVQHGKLDAFVFDRHNMEYVVKVNRDLALLPDDIGEEHIVVGMPLHHKELQQEVDRFIVQYREDGTYAGMYDRWFSKEPPPMPVSEIPVPEKPTRRLKVGTEGLNEPMNFYGADGKLTGFDLEFIRRLALFLNAELEVSAMSFDALVPAAESGKIDLLIANLNDTPERAERMLFSKDYVDSAISVMVRKDRLETKADKISSALQLNDAERVIGAETGTVAFREAEKVLPKARFKLFRGPSDMFLALETKKLDAVVYDRPTLDYAALNRGRLAVLPDELGTSHIAVGAPFRNKPLLERVDAFIKTYRADGTYDDMYRRWVLSKSPVMPDIPEPSSPTETILVGTNCENEPICFVGNNGQLSGFDIEFIRRLSVFLNVKIDVRNMDYPALFPAAAAGKIDLAVAALDATEERKESMLFSDDYIDNPIAVMIRKEDSGLGETEIDAVSRLSGKRIGVMNGTTADIVAKECFSTSACVYCNSFSEMVVALETGRIEGFLMDEPQSRVFLREKPDFQRLPEEFLPFDYAFVFSKQEQKLCDEMSKLMRELKQNGTLKELEAKWFLGDESKQTMPPAPTEAPNGVLRMATVPQFEPMAFVRRGEVVGYDIEIAQRITERLGYRLEPVVMEWGSYLESIASGKTRFGGGSTNVTEERKQKLLFSEPTYRGGTVAVVKTGHVEAATGNIENMISRFGREFVDSFDRTFLRENRWKLILEGLKITILITVFAAFFGTILAFFVCAARRSANFFVRGLAKLYIALMQGMPILVILMILYYVVFAKIDINAALVAVIGFALNFSVYVGEMMRSALDGIPRGQYEAALALGFKRSTAFRKVIFPQMLRRILPVYRGEFINMLKMTSIVGYIAIQDLTKMSDIIRSRTYEAFFPLIATAVIYFTVAHLLASFLTFLEYRLDPKNRRRTSR